MPTDECHIHWDGSSDGVFTVLGQALRLRLNVLPDDPIGTLRICASAYGGTALALPNSTTAAPTWNDIPGTSPLLQARQDGFYPRDYIRVRSSNVGTHYSFDPTDFGWLAWNYPPFSANTSATAGVAGTVYVARLPVPVSGNISNLYVAVGTPGAAMVAGQNFAALYSSTGALLQTTADQSAVWNSSGLKTMAIPTTPITSAFVYFAWFANAGTMPRFTAGANGAIVNGGLTGANALWASTSDTLRTTTMPANLGAFTAFPAAPWVAVGP